MFIVGLTGGIGSGKSVVSSIFVEYGIVVVDADIIARESVQRGSHCFEHIVNHFGRTILLENGELDRRQLRKIIFTDIAEKQWLESITHPIVRKKILDDIKNARSVYCILSSPILLETTLFQLVNRILVIDLDESQQLQRASARDGSNIEDIRNIMASQISRPERLQRADDIIDNSGSLVHTQHQVAELHNQYLQLASISPK